ncbi:hypothetical protein FB567DRAFT_615332 [Paraphoma chrysanthemicola]|uniref:tyrosinase n=1 Tax=Paraphoma chrysanthemicola TaxID=798071 RepID=A0A8K0QU28_9PLEO|nr:hypothetical protein FB567DRAFT_615332 [Paraphoma chrysanthemicola]
MSKFWTWSFLLRLLTASSIVFTPADCRRTLFERQSDVSVVSGISWRDAQGNVPVRREVRDLKDNHSDQWNLYLLALDRIQWQDQTGPLSYYGLASIHGRPFRTWGDAPGLDHKIGTSGYCPHNNILFLGWHRPYLALFEEQLYKEVHWFAERASEGQLERYRSAANQFRMPYWDWAKGEGGVPDFFTWEYISVTRPDGTSDNMWNPLYAYYFHPVIPDDFDSKWIYLNGTQRWPSSDEINSTSDQAHMLSNYEEQKGPLVNQVDLSFRQDTLNEFASTLEQGHGWVHGIIGGGYLDNTFKGHMWPLEYSAYEPLFMLHHTNVDRLFAMYQAAHPGRTFTSASVGDSGNVWLENGQMVDADTPLLPFRKSSGGFWTTKDVRNTTTFGYAYPETIKKNEQSEEEYEEEIVAVIATMYGSTVRAMLNAKTAPAGGSSLLASDGAFTDWSIDAAAITTHLPPTFVVRFSLVGDFSSDKPVDVGTWTRLMPASHTHSGVNDQASTETPYEGRISLTASLIDRVVAGQLMSLNASDVVPYLKDKLTWKVYGDDGQLPQSSLSALTFQVVSNAARIPDDPAKPILYSKDVVRHPEVTIGKAGGVAA